MKNLLIVLLLAGGIAYAGSKFYLHQEVADGMDSLVIMLSPYAKVEYDGVASTMGGELTIEGIRVDFREFSDDLVIDRVGIDTPSYFALLSLKDPQELMQDGFPDYLTFLFEGVHIPADADYYQAMYAMSATARGASGEPDTAALCTGRHGFSPAALKGLGYDEQVVSMTMTLENDPADFAFDIGLSMQEMWEVSARVRLAGSPLPKAGRMMPTQPKLKSMHLEMVDQSLNSRVQRYCESLGLTPEQALTAQLDTFRYMGLENGIEFDEYVMDPYREFLGGKSTLLVNARPNDPIAFSQIDLYKPSDVPALLNLEAAAR